MRRVNPLMLKVLVLLFLVVCLMIPVGMVKDLILERQAYQSEVARELTKSTSGEQTVAGPVLVVPYKQLEGKVLTDKRLLVLPAQLNIDGQVQVTPLKRAIYTFQSFQSATHFTGSFPRAQINALRAKGVTIGTPYMSIAVTDGRGLGKSEPASVAGKTYAFGAGTDLKAFPDGVHALLTGLNLADTGAIDFDVNFKINGSSRISYVPLGENTQVSLAGNWAHPKFAGSTVTQSRNVTAQGFNATWESNWFANKLNADFIAAEENGGVGIAARAVQTVNAVDGISDATAPATVVAHPNSSASLDNLYRVDTDLIQTVDHYQLNERMVKYSMLFIGLTFLAFFMFEVLRQLRVHPLQYALVGVALTVFFVLLLSLSEYIGFNKAYVLAGLACVGQITFYVSHILHSMKRGVGFGLALATLYAVLFGLLQSEDVSLLLGSVGLFVVVSAVMFATRRLNWYALTDGLGSDKV